jgi:Tfp pilus assembly protein PilF
LNQLDAAERVAQQVGKLGPKGVLVMARYLGLHGKPEEAAAAINKTAGEAGNVQDAGSLALALASASKGDPLWLEQADQLLASALKAQPDSNDMLLKQAFLRHLQGHYDDEIAVYQAVLDRHPADLHFLNNMAWTLSEQLDRPKEGLERVDQALKQTSGEPHMLDTRGVILTRLGRLDEAIEDLKAASASLASGSVFFHLARAYLNKGDTAQFRKFRDRAHDAGLKPEDLQPSERPDWKKMIVDKNSE